MSGRCLTVVTDNYDRTHPRFDARVEIGGRESAPLSLELAEKTLPVDDLLHPSTLHSSRI